MAEGIEAEGRLDLEDDNYTEEMDDDVEEQIESEGAEERSNENGRDLDEVRSEDSSKDRFEELADTEADRSNFTNESVGKEEKPIVSVDEEDKNKHSELLAIPPHGSEIFIGGLPRDVSEEDLWDLCESFGEIFEVRLMKNRDTGESKGFAFVAFKTREVAETAVGELHSKNYKGRTLRCSLAESKYRLFIGNVPKSLTDDDFRKIIDDTGPGAEVIELIKDPQNHSRNRGFAFIEYYNNACADYSRQKMASASYKLDGYTPTVTWADPKITPDSSAAASQVKALYVKNIPENTPSDKVKQLFERHGEVIKVVMPPGKSSGKRDFGFVHYVERSSALKAVKDTEKYEIDGQQLEVCLAKPQSEKKFEGANSYNSGPHPNYPAHPGFGGFLGNPFAAPGVGYGGSTSFQQPMIYGRGPMPAGMQMVPMVLPDGQIGYVLQQPGVQMTPPQPRRNDRSNGSGGPQGRGSRNGSGDDGNRNRRYRPY